MVPAPQWQLRLAPLAGRGNSDWRQARYPVIARSSATTASAEALARRWKQSRATPTTLDCRVAGAPRNDGWIDVSPYPRDGIRPSFASSSSPSITRGHREGRVAACTRGPRAKNIARARVDHRYSGDTPAFPAQLVRHTPPSSRRTPGPITTGRGCCTPLSPPSLRANGSGLLAGPMTGSGAAIQGHAHHSGLPRPLRSSQ